MTDTVPCDNNAERGIIACCIIDPDCIGKCLDRNIAVDTFHNPVYQLIYKALVEMWNTHPEIDEISLADNLRTHGWLDEVGGLEGINEISGSVETSMHMDMWLELVEGHGLSRKLRTLCLQTLDSINEGRITPDLLATTLDDEIMRITKDRFRPEYFHDASESVELAVKAMDERKAAAGRVGVAMGIPDLDFALKGFKKSELTLLAARPSVGKTAFSLHCLRQAVVVGRVPTLYQSIEMSASALMVRMVHAMANVRLGLIDEDAMTKNQEKALEQAEDSLRGAPFWIDETPNPSVAQIRARARRLKAHSGLGLIVIDYLQLIRPRDPRIPREQQVAEISNSLKNLSKELDIPILLLCQLNRQSELAGRGPRLSDLRESGQLEQDADVVIMLWNPDPEEPDRVRATISKNRNGQCGLADLKFQKTVQRFSPYDNKDEELAVPQNRNIRFGK